MVFMDEKLSIVFRDALGGPRPKRGANNWRGFFEHQNHLWEHFRGAEGASKLWKILRFHRKNQYLRRNTKTFWNAQNTIFGFWRYKKSNAGQPCWSLFQIFYPTYEALFNGFYWRFLLILFGVLKFLRITLWCRSEILKTAVFIC